MIAEGEHFLLTSTLLSCLFAAAFAGENTPGCWRQKTRRQSHQKKLTIFKFGPCVCRPVGTSEEEIKYLQQMVSVSLPWSCRVI